MRISSKCTGHSGVWLHFWDDLCRNSPENLPPFGAQLLRIVWFLPKLWYSNIVFPFFFEQGRRMWTNMLISAQCYGVLEVPDGFFCEKKGAPAPFIDSTQVTGRLTLRQIKVHPLNGRPHCSVHFGLWNVLVGPKWMITLRETNTSHLKMDSWKMYFLLGIPIFRCYVSFRECKFHFWILEFKFDQSLFDANFPDLSTFLRVEISQTSERLKPGNITVTPQKSNKLIPKMAFSISSMRLFPDTLHPIPPILVFIPKKPSAFRWHYLWWDCSLTTFVTAGGRPQEAPTNICETG